MTLKGINIKELKICKYNVYKKNLRWLWCFLRFKITLVKGVFDLQIDKTKNTFFFK